jgi:hypothetical protein
MFFLAATVAGLFGAAVLGIVVTFGAADIFTKVGGVRDGGPAMAAYFTIGPFGLLAGFLFGFGAVLWAGGNGRFQFIAKACGIGGALLLAFAGLVVVMTVRRNS